MERREELISAYLDGELPPDQRAEVERWLADSAELRQLHDELKALGSSLRSLARHTLDHDLGGVVLRRAERSVLGEDAGPSIAGKVGPSHPAASRWSRGAGWRRVIWPALAVAAAILILVFNPQEPPAERQVAQAPKDQGAVAARDNAGGDAVESLATHPTETKAGDAKLDDFTAPSTAGHDRFRTSGDEAESRDMPAESPAPTAPSATAADPPAQGAAVVSRMLRKSSPADLPPGTIVCNVPARFLDDKSFEKLAMKLDLVAVRSEAVLGHAIAQAKEQAERAEARAAEPPAATAPVSYGVVATDEQVAKLIDALRKNSISVTKIAERDRPDSKKNEEPAETDRARTHRFVLQVRSDAPPAADDDQP